MTEAERRRVGERRRMIFEGVANCVPIETLMEAHHCSALEIQADVSFVLRKIREYRWRRTTEVPKEMENAKVGSHWVAPGGGPPIGGETYNDIRLNRLALLDTLSRLGPMYLSSDLLLPRISIQNLDHPSMVKEAIHRLRA